MNLRIGLRVLIAFVVAAILGLGSVLLGLVKVVLVAILPALITASIIAIGARRVPALRQLLHPPVRTLDKIAFPVTLVLAALTFGIGVTQVLAFVWLISTLPAARTIIAGLDRLENDPLDTTPNRWRVFGIATHQVFLLIAPVLYLLVLAGTAADLWESATLRDGTIASITGDALFAFIVLSAIEGLTNPWDSELSMARRAWMSWTLRAEPKARINSAIAENVFKPRETSAEPKPLSPKLELSSRRQQQLAGSVLLIASVALISFVGTSTSDDASESAQPVSVAPTTSNSPSYTYQAQPRPSSPELSPLERLIEERKIEPLIAANPRPLLPDVEGLLLRDALTVEAGRPVVLLVTRTEEQQLDPPKPFPGPTTVALVVFLSAYAAPTLVGKGELAPLSNRRTLRFVGPHGILLCLVWALTATVAL